MILVFGILSLFTVPIIFGPMAWSMGNQDMRKIRAGQMDREGQTMTEIGRVCGMVAALLSVGALGMVLLYFLAVFFCCGIGGMLPFIR